MKTSVILCTRNRAGEVARFCNSLIIQTELPDELIIVDSSDFALKDTDDFRRLFSEISGKVVLKYLTSDPGLTRQRNIGIASASGEILYFFDDDVILDKEFIRIMNDTFRSNPLYKGGMGTFIGMSPGSYKNRLERAFRCLLFMQHDYGSGRFYPSGFPSHPYGKEKFLDVEVLGGGLTGYRKEVFDNVKFDECLTGYAYMEDVDFSRRVSYNYKLFFNPAAKLEHRHGAREIKSDRLISRMLMVNHRYLFYKNFYPKNKLSLIPHIWSITGMFIVAFLFKGDNRWEFIRGYLDGLKEFHLIKK